MVVTRVDLARLGCPGSSEVLDDVSVWLQSHQVVSLCGLAVIDMRTLEGKSVL